MATTKYRVLAGFHKGKDGKIYRKGEIVKSEYNLLEAYPNKFLLLGSSKDTIVKPFKRKGKKGSLIDKEKGGIAGKDVTKYFPSAMAKSLRVIKKTKGKDVGSFFVVKESDMASPINPKALSKTKIERFIDEVDEEAQED